MNAWSDADVAFMRQAIAEAERAREAGEVPVGAVLVRTGEVLGASGNRSIVDADPSGHAEILAMRNAAKALGNHRLAGATLYVTLEPCAMCAGAAIEARLARIVFAAYDERAGAVGSALDLSAHPGLNHRFEVNGGLLADESAELLREFFEARR